MTETRAVRIRDFTVSFGAKVCTYVSGMWKQKWKLEAEVVEAVLFLWKRKRKKSTASAST